MPYEHNFETLIRAKWSAPVPGVALDMMHNIYKVMFNKTIPGYKSCPNCQKRLLKALGNLYLADKEERKQVALAAEKPVKRVAVKTKKNAVRSEQQN